MIENQNNTSATKHLQLQDKKIDSKVTKVKFLNMVSLRSGKKVPFLGKNIPKRAYTYKKPIPKEEESELITKIGSISIQEPNATADTTVEDNNVNSATYESDETIVESTVQNDLQSTLETTDQSEIDIDTSEMPNKTVGIIERFEAEMTKADQHFKLMGLLNASTKLMNSSNPVFLDSSASSESSQDSASSDSSQDMTEDSILTSEISSIDEGNEKQNVFSDISSASSLSSTLKTMIDKAIDSESSSEDEDDLNDVGQLNAADERRPKFSENSYNEIYEMYNVIQL